MNPGEKAKQIVDKFLPLVEAFTEVGRLENAKKCALIAVDEMIDNNEVCKQRYRSDYDRVCIKSYWLEVKQEIENYETNI